MDGTYDVCLRGQKVGTVILDQKGLYYSVICRCVPFEDQMMHLIMEVGHHSENLGLMIPANDCIELKKKVPIKRVGEGKPAFYLLERDASTENFIPIKSDEPVQFLHCLEECSFAVRQEEPGVLLRKKTTEKAKNRG